MQEIFEGDMSRYAVLDFFFFLFSQIPLFVCPIVSPKYRKVEFSIQSYTFRITLGLEFDLRVGGSLPVIQSSVCCQVPPNIASMCLFKYFVLSFIHVIPFY